MKQFALGLAALLTMAMLPGAAQAKVLSAEARDAARVRELHLMLSSVNMRCKMIGVNFQQGFETLSSRQQPTLERAELTLKEYFEVRSKADLRASYDRFHIRMLNFYGTGRTDQQSCGMFANLVTMLAQADESGALLGKIAGIMVEKPLIEDEAQ